MAVGDNYPERTGRRCPVCKSPMKKGYITSARGIYWKEDIPSFLCRGQPLGPKAEGWIGCRYVKAYRCAQCGIFKIGID